jgi:hypothetical protein
MGESLVYSAVWPTRVVELVICIINLRLIFEIIMNFDHFIDQIIIINQE